MIRNITNESKTIRNCFRNQHNIVETLSEHYSKHWKTNRKPWETASENDRTSAKHYQNIIRNIKNKSETVKNNFRKPLNIVEQRSEHHPKHLQTHGNCQKRFQKPTGHRRNSEIYQKKTVQQMSLSLHRCLLISALCQGRTYLQSHHSYATKIACCRNISAAQTTTRKMWATRSWSTRKKLPHSGLPSLVGRALHTQAGWNMHHRKTVENGGARHTSGTQTAIISRATVLGAAAS